MNTKFERSILYIILTIGALIMVTPFIWMISASLKDIETVFSDKLEFIPETFHWENYKLVWERVPFARFYLNSITVASLTTLGQLFASSLAAFALARIRFKGSKLLFVLMLATMMIPFHITIIPVFLIFKKLGWIDTTLPLWVPSIFGSAFGIFLLRQFFIGIPKDLEDAAKIDGCNPFQIYYKIFLPLARPAMTALGIFVFMWSWNDLFGPLIYLHSAEKMTLTAGLNFFQGQYQTDYHLMMSGAFLSVIPILIIFFFAQKSFIKGITMSGLKG